MSGLGNRKSLLEIVPPLFILVVAFIGWAISRADVVDVQVLILLAAASVLLGAATTFLELAFPGKTLLTAVALLLILHYLQLQVVSPSLYIPLVFVVGAWMSLNGQLWEIIIGFVAIIIWFRYAVDITSAHSAPPDIFNSGGAILIGVICYLFRRRLLNLYQNIREHEIALKEIINTSGRGFILTHENKVIEFNQLALDILGIDEHEIIGKNLNVFLPGVDSQSGRLFINSILRRDGELSIGEFSRGVYNRGKEKYVSYFFEDISQKKRAEAAKELVYEVTSLLSDAKVLREGLRKTTRRVVKQGEWDAVGCWLYSPERGVLTPVAWNMSRDDNELSEATWASQYKRNEGSIGHCWEGGAVMWQHHYDCSRWESLNKAGMKTQVLVAMRNANETIGVIEFTSSKRINQDDEIQNELNILAGQIAQFIYRTRAENALTSSRALEINDDIMQNLVIAQLYSRMGDNDKSLASIDKAIEGARQVLARLIHAISPTPGSLVRKEDSIEDENSYTEDDDN